MKQDLHKDKSSIITEWVMLYSDDLYKRALYKINDEDLAQDFVQETFVSAINAYEKFEARSSVRTWLNTILNNKIIDHYRKADSKNISLNQLTEHAAMKRSDDFFDETNNWRNANFDVRWDDAENLLDRKDFLMILENCMDGLPNNWKDIVESKYVLDKDAKEICKEYNISTTNYWQIIHRSKLLLRKCISTKWED